MPKAIKVVTLEGTFPELPSPKMYQQGRGEGGTLKAAFAAAGRDLFKKPGIKARRLSAFTLTVSVGIRYDSSSGDTDGTDGLQKA
jgi:hypothetical protein